MVRGGNELLRRPVEVARYRARIGMGVLRGHYDRVRLPRRLQGFADVVAGLPATTSELREPYRRYVETVSTPEMAVSLELAAFVLAYCRVMRPAGVIDAGSGFSSYVFRRYAADAAPRPSVVSVDDSEAWLERTAAFLRDEGVGDDGLVPLTSFQADGGEPADLILHDLGTLEVGHAGVRGSLLPGLIERLAPSGAIVLDDFSEAPWTEAYRREAVRVTSANGLERYSLRTWTVDEYGRYSILARRRSA